MLTQDHPNTTSGHELPAAEATAQKADGKAVSHCRANVQRLVACQAASEHGASKLSSVQLKPRTADHQTATQCMGIRESSGGPTPSAPRQMLACLVLSSWPWPQELRDALCNQEPGTARAAACAALRSTTPAALSAHNPRAQRNTSGRSNPMSKDSAIAVYATAAAIPRLSEG